MHSGPLTQEQQLLIESIRLEIAGISDPAARIQRAMDRIQASRADYYWVGVYLLQGDTLILGPFAGPATEHTRIPIGRGVCGTAVAEDRNIVVDDVSQRENYLACNLLTKSEIVVLIRDDSGRILGQIDVDCTRVAGVKEDEPWLAEAALILAADVAALVEG